MNPGLCLVTYFADCVPVYFIDPVNKSIGAAHSGWRGTVANITHEVVKLMKETYGSRPEVIHTSSVHQSVRTVMRLMKLLQVKIQTDYGLKESDMMLYHTKDDKYQLNLQTANYYNMIHEGILPDNIGITNLCTSCNSDWMFSHRASYGKRGVLCGFMSICQ